MVVADLTVLRGLLPFLRPYRARLAFAGAAATAGPMLLAARIWLLKILIDDVLKGHRPGLVPLIAAAFVAIALVRGVLSGWSQHATGTVATHLVRGLRIGLFTHLQGLSLRYFHTQRLGDLLTRLSVDIGAIEELLVSGVTTFVANVVTIALFFALLIALDPVLVLVALAVLPALGSAPSWTPAAGERHSSRSATAPANSPRPQKKGYRPSQPSKPSPAGRTRRRATPMWHDAARRPG